MEKIAFIINPQAASGKASKRWDKLRSRLTTLCPQASIYFTQERHHASHIARRLSQKGYSKIICGGGDGTLNEVITGLSETQDEVFSSPTIGLLPLGTASDFCRSLKIPSNPLAALDVCFGKGRKHVSIGQIQLLSKTNQPITRYFVNVLSLGFTGDTAALLNRIGKPLGSTLSYLTGALYGILKHKTYSIDLIGKKPRFQFEEHISNVVVANGGYFGGGIPVAPNANPSSGDFILLVVKAQTKSALIFDLLPKVYLGKHIGHPSIILKNCEELRISPQTAGADISVEADGEAIGKLPIKVTKSPVSFFFCVPEIKNNLETSSPQDKSSRPFGQN